MSSGYKMACSWLKEQRGTANGGEASNPKKWNEFWNFIWSLNCPSKVKHFMWRACKNILPTNYDLKLKKNSGGGCVWSLRKSGVFEPCSLGL